MVSLFIEEIVTLGLFDFQREFGFLEEGFKIWFSVGKAETLFTLEGDVDPVGVLPLSGWIYVVLDVLFLPEIPDSDEERAFGLKVCLDLLEDKQLRFFVGEVMHERNTEDMVEFTQVFPDLRFGDVSLDEIVVGIFLLGFFKQLWADVQPGVLDRFG